MLSEISQMVKDKNHSGEILLMWDVKQKTINEQTLRNKKQHGGYQRVGGWRG